MHYCENEECGKPPFMAGYCRECYFDMRDSFRAIRQTDEYKRLAAKQDGCSGGKEHVAKRNRGCDACPCDLETDRPPRNVE